MNRWARLGSVAFLAAAMTWAGLAALPASAAPLGSCSTTRGTIIAVDFGHWSGPIIRGCGVQPDGQPDSSPYALLADGGFTTAGTAHDGPALICRIGDAAFHGGTQYPTPDEDHCVVTPPATAYWSYWLAAPGATTWTYASMSQALPSGGVAYWEFGSGQTPAAALIGQLRAHNATSADAGTAPSPPAPAPPAPTSGRARSAATQASSGPTGTPTRSGTPTTGTPSATATTAADGSSTPGPAGPAGNRIVSSVAPAGHDRGSAVPVVITVVIVAALGAAGGVSLVRRRRREQG